MNIEKIQTQKISEAVEEQIEKMIVSGAFQSGEKLPSVRELCDIFGVGRSAVRDAITTLKGKGIVDVRRGEGAFVCQFDCAKLFASSVLLPSFDDIQELFQVRKILEAGIAQMAAFHRTDHDLKVMKKILSDEAAERWEADYEFHLALAKAAKNDILIQFIQFISEMMKKTMVDFHIYVEKNNSIIKIIAEQHEEIYKTIKNRDCKRANEAMIYHLNYVEKLLQR
ncbi:FadR/GntR family transcriptional regulator [Metabacillus fastidiosus]|uniref:FadR/GntR family transcriptional regulator n=1 Tax=Metabacillus fastidiosus TaxID=1458 RepID=UPI002DB708BF|nr:FadR/GntR family transcriptional regulator [Metabacillus fastidiosus]MEC2076277.1 FadR/GntR family transcriptional regulator [Metabacillus fastidiosus]